MGPLLDNKILILILILGRLISDCSITSINDIVFVFDHIQLKIIIAFDNLLQIKKYFSLNLKQMPNSSKKNLIWLSNLIQKKLLRSANLGHGSLLSGGCIEKQIRC